MNDMMHWRIQVLRQMAHYGLTPAEQRIALEFLRGQSNAEIAEALDLAERTVKNQLTEIMRKTHTRNRVSLVLELLDIDFNDDVDA